MKKLNLLGMLVSTFALLGISNVNAEGVEVRTEADLKACVLEESAECVLKDSISLTEVLHIQNQVTIDLAGKAITADATLEVTGGLINVNRGGDLVIEDSVGTGKISGGATEKVYAAIQLTKSGEGSDGDTASVTVRGGTIEGYYYGITGNGTRHNTYIEITGGTVKNLAVNDGSAVYNPQNGGVVVGGGLIEGATGIEMRSGSLEIYGGTIRGIGDFVEVPNGNGSTSSGVGIAIAQHVTQNHIYVVVDDGIIEGYYAVHESNPQNNSQENLNVDLSLWGGTFRAINGGNKAVESADCVGFVLGGTYNTPLESEFIHENAELSQDEDGNYIATWRDTDDSDDELDDVPNTSGAFPFASVFGSIAVIGVGIYTVTKIVR